ncbi:MAG: flagellar protein FlgN [Zoogloea sp.]|nr:flagellar protein FlgN [Zoogloea sp.]
MIPLNALPPRLARLLDEEVVLLRAFIELLRREEAMLVDGRVDALFPLAAEKVELCRKLQHLSDDRALLMGQAGLAASDANIRSTLAASAAALAQWDTVIGLARDAREHNRVNGGLIRTRMQNNQQALTVLLAAVDQPQVYGPDGQTRPATGGRHFGSV